MIRSLFALTLLGNLLSCSFQIIPPCAHDECADMAPPDMAQPDPSRPGPLRVASLELAVPLKLNSTAQLQVTVVGPGLDSTTLAPPAQPYPLVIVSPALGLPRALLYDYAARLASFGVLVVLQNPRSELDHQQYVADTRLLLDWLLQPGGGGSDQRARIPGPVAAGMVGLVGYGLGGKISVLVAQQDQRVGALFLLDPLDPQAAVPGPLARQVFAQVRLGLSPPVLLGETISQSPSGPGRAPCAPADQDYVVLLPAAPAGTLGLTATGAAYADFTDDLAQCGGWCTACSGGTAPRERTHDLAVRYVAAYFLTAYSLAGSPDFATMAQIAADSGAGLVTMIQ